MLTYALIGLSLVLVGVTGLQFSYLFYVDRLYRERQKYLRTLEGKYARLSKRLDAAEQRIAEQNEILTEVYPEYFVDDDNWADVLDDH